MPPTPCRVLWCVCVCVCACVGVRVWVCVTVWCIERLRIEDVEDLTMKVGLREFLKRFDALKQTKKKKKKDTAASANATPS